VPNSVIRDWPYSIRIAAVLVSAGVICALLYTAQIVLIPLALGGLLTFLLTPVVARFEHWGLGRIPAVLTAVTLVALTLALVGWTVMTQVTSLAAELPRYRANIIQKVDDYRQMFKGGALERLQATLEDVKQRLEEDDEEQEDDASVAEPAYQSEPEDAEDVEPVPVKVAVEENLLPDTAYLTPVAQVLGTAGLVIVLTFFMLIQREEVLSRLVSLAGTRSLAVTTKALDEAARRISRYLLMQFFINACYGLAVGVGLFLIGVPYAALWGLSGFVFRYIPYVGPWVAALLPIGVSLVHFPGWSIVLIVVALFVALELFVNNVMEPLLYGQSVGLSSLAVIVSAVFWTWMWGPVGLVLSTPLTVCLVVLGEHIPGLAIFDRMLSDRPALKPHLWLYQRLLAGDEEDAEEIVEEYLDEHNPDSAVDDLLVPALLFTRREHAGRRIAEDDQAQIQATLEDIIGGLPHWATETAAKEAEGADDAPPSDRPARKVTLVGFPTEEADVLVLQLLARLLDAEKCMLEILSEDLLIAERIAAIEEKKPAIICLSSLPPGGFIKTRAICKSLHTRYPDAKIVVGRWTSRAISDRCRKLLRSSGADAVVATVTEMREALMPMIQFHLVSDAPSGTEPQGPHRPRREAQVTAS
jgi:predicted PurR-regulated permease PerM